jgi:hypothetical protein
MIIIINNLINTIVMINAKNITGFDIIIISTDIKLKFCFNLSLILHSIKLQLFYYLFLNYSNLIPYYSYFESYLEKFNCSINYYILII